MKVCDICYGLGCWWCEKKVAKPTRREKLRRFFQRMFCRHDDQPDPRNKWVIGRVLRYHCKKCGRHRFRIIGMPRSTTTFY